MLKREDSFIFLVSLILVIIQVCIIFTLRMPSEDKSDIDEENRLSEKEKKGVVGAFDELEDDETRRQFSKSLDEDSKDLDDDDDDE